MMLGIAARSSVRNARPLRKHPGAHLGKEDGHPDGQGNGHEKQRQERRNQRAVNERQSAEMAVDGIPVNGLLGRRVDDRPIKEMKSELSPGQVGVPHQFPVAISTTIPKMLSAHNTIRPLKSPIGQRRVPAGKQETAEPGIRGSNGAFCGRFGRRRIWLQAATGLATHESQARGQSPRSA